jgi:DNA-binding IclR family transcriptional regulator
VTQDPASRRYSVGLRAFALGSKFMTYDKLAREALPILHGLVKDTGHSARLSVRDGDEVIYLIGAEGPHFVDTGWRAGTWLPWYGSSAGRILLAYLPPDEAQRLVKQKPMTPVTPYTISDPKKLTKILERARQRGYDSQRNETTVGLGTVAVPILGPNQKVIGALSLAFPEAAVEPENEVGLAEVLHTRARQISLRMGSIVYSVGRAN